MKATLLIGILATTCVTHAAVQTIYKCSSKDGKTTYSNSPCPRAKAVGAAGPAAPVNLRTVTQEQANLAADCHELVFNRNDEFWEKTEGERALFDQICPAFGYKAPLGPETDAFNTQHSKQLLKKLREKFENVPSTTRVYQGGRRMPPLFDRY